MNDKKNILLHIFFNFGAFNAFVTVMRSVGTAKAGFGCIFVLLLITGYAHAGQANVANEGIFGTLRDWASKLSREIYRLRYGIGPRQKESGTEAAKGTKAQLDALLGGLVKSNRSGLYYFR